MVSGILRRMNSSCCRCQISTATFWSNTRWRGWHKMRIRASSTSLRCSRRRRTLTRSQSSRCAPRWITIRAVANTRIRSLTNSNVPLHICWKIIINSNRSSGIRSRFEACLSSLTPITIFTCMELSLSRWSRSLKILASPTSRLTMPDRTGSPRNRRVKTFSSTWRRSTKSKSSSWTCTLTRLYTS